MKSTYILIFFLISLNLFSLSSTLKILEEITFEKKDIYIDGSDSAYQITVNFEPKDNYLYIYPTYYDEDLINKGAFKIYFKEYSSSDKNTVANYLKSDYSTIELNSELFIKIEDLQYKKASIFFITYGKCIFKANFLYANSVNFPMYNILSNFQLSQFILKKKKDVTILYPIRNKYDDTLTILSIRVLKTFLSKKIVHPFGYIFATLSFVTSILL